MKSRPVAIATINGTSTPAKRTLFRIALTVALVGSISVSAILLLNSGFALARLRYFIDIGLHPLHITSAILMLFGILSLATFIILTIGVVKVNKTLAIIAAILLGCCSIGLIIFSIWSFLTITSGHLPASINTTIVTELDQTQYSVGTGNNIIIENTNKMARLEKQHQCCGLNDPLEDYRSRQPSAFGSLNPTPASSGGSGNSRSKTTSTQRNAATFGSSVQLPISCCNEKYRSADNLCIDMFANNTSPLNRYNTDGCYAVVARHKFERIQRQGFTTVVAACLAVISCIALAAVVRLLGEGYQIVPLRATT
ncbi:unnamed protein product [Adineta steineri]|uniref:Tetraspanin n=1 Tax=Adineta steineri TaxID=433720 RepID=A0A813PRA7_9BILA|nr:unnamed protein product [Adineta steineri]